MKEKFYSENSNEKTDFYDFQDEIEYWKIRMCRLTLLVEQLSSHPTKMVSLTLRTGHCKLLKLWIECEVKVMR